MYLNLFVERGDEEVILVLVPHFARVGEAKDVDLIVAWLATSGNRRRGRVGRLHAGHLTLRNQGGDDTSAGAGIARAAKRVALWQSADMSTQHSAVSGISNLCRFCGFAHMPCACHAPKSSVVSRVRTTIRPH